MRRLKRTQKPSLNKQLLLWMQYSHMTRFHQANRLDVKLITNCNNCGGNCTAQRDKCPAFGQQCHKCKKWNHYKKCCKYESSQIPDKKNFVKKLYNRKQQPDHSSTDDTFYVDGIEHTSSVDTIGTQTENRNGGFITILYVKDKPVEMKMDTRATCNVMANHTFLQLSVGQILKCNKTTNLVAYGGNKI